jgi:hypothetical protein
MDSGNQISRQEDESCSDHLFAAKNESGFRHRLKTMRAE